MTMIDALVAPFLRVEIFQGLELRQIEEIARRAERIVYRPGDVIVNGNFSGDGAVLLASGEAVIAGESGHLHERNGAVPAGSLLNEMAMLIETDLSLVVFARTTVRALKISRSQLHQQMVEDPAIAEHFIAKISGRLTDFVDGFRRIEQMFGGAGEQRRSAAYQTG
jgi:signal-transduction protein with cAMP-binding, CBS, and nucleotidyltransferase domain